MRQKKITREEYAKRYCSDKRIRDRRVLYVSAETHRKISYIAHLFREEYVTAMSLADSILLHHIEQHKDLFESLIQKEREKPLIPDKPDEWEQEYEDEDEQGDTPEEVNESEPLGSL